MFTEAVTQVAVAGPRRHSADADRYSCGNHRRHVGVRGHRSLPPRRAGAQLVDQFTGYRRSSAGTGKTLAEAAKSVTAGTDVHLALGTGAGVGEDRLLGSAAPESGAPLAYWTPNSPSSVNSCPLSTPRWRRSVSWN